jgi:hypothetical protein
MIICKAVFECHILAFDIASFFQTPETRVHERRVIMRTPAQEKSDHRHSAPLRGRRKRPYRCPAERRYELSPSKAD